jgi:hypothetical protein
LRLAEQVQDEPRGYGVLKAKPEPTRIPCGRFLPYRRFGLLFHGGAVGACGFRAVMEHPS